MKRIQATLVFVFLALGALSATAAETPDRWLHIRVVDSGDKGETVKVNLPLSLAEKILPAISAGKLDGGRIRLHDVTIDGVDLRALLEAIRGAQDAEFVTVETADETVRVAKSGGYLLVKVSEKKEQGDEADIRVPFSVVEALLSAGRDELDLGAALHALAASGEDFVITARDDSSEVRIWIDSLNTAE